jgi:NADH-quinone oxidoreductase subunit H
MQPLLDALGQLVGGPGNALILLLALLKIALLLASILGVLPFIILYERKLISWTQDRPGPNRSGPWGLFHGLVDGIKLFFKEEIIPTGADRFLYLIAPTLVTAPAFLALCIVPIGPIVDGPTLAAVANFLGISPATLGPSGSVSQIAIAVTNPNVGILYVLAITSIGVYGMTLAGWASNSKWSLLGGIRASAQMISYEISMSLSVIGVLLITGSLNLYDIIDVQKGGVHHWNIWAQPLAFVLFVIAMFAETNRLPFDLAEGESELTGGFHTEYSSMKFALFFLGEYVNMITVSAICSTLFLGGFTGLLPLFPEGTPLYYLAGPLLLPAKIFFFLTLFILARATMPRMRYDQLMNLGWKVMLPLGLMNLVITAIGVGLGADPDTGKVTLPAKFAIGAVTLVLLFAADAYYTSKSKGRMLRDYQNVRPEAA